MTALAQQALPESPLENILRDRIAREGPIGIADYMSLCLGHPQHGYYMTRDPFGARGDFTTAPEVSQMFGEMIGAYVAAQWQLMGAPQPFHLIECGPGRGTLMADMLRVFARLPDLMKALRIHLVEMSPVLRDVQQKNLEAYADRIEWHEDINNVPAGAFALVANEFLDALPVRQFQFHQREWRERCIGLEKGTLGYTLGGRVALNISANEGDIFETSPVREKFIRNIAARLKCSPGFALLIDYGHDRSGLGDTLQAVHRHHYANPLERPGEADLTSHVDFAALKKMTEEIGCEVGGPIPQGKFLENCGISARAAILQQKNPQAGAEAALRRLTAADEMGELFKVMILSSFGKPVFIS